jgi:translation initiation factor 4B
MVYSLWNVADFRLAKDRGDERFAGEWRRSGPLPSLEPAQRRGYERHDREEGAGGRRQNSFREEGDGKVRDFSNWERKGPLSPLPATSPTGSERPRGEFRRRSPAPSADGSERFGGHRERPHVERQPSAAEKDNEWRKGARPVAPQPTSPVAPQSRPRLELKKRSEQPVASETPSASSDKPNPFGGARPIDTTQREKEIEERRAAAAAARKAKEEKEREERKAAREAEAQEKAASEAGTPIATKSGFDVLRRGSGSAEGEEQAKTEKADRPPRVEKPQSKGPDNWRVRAAPKEAPKAEGESDGWSTVTTGKRGGRGSGRVPAA